MEVTKTISKDNEFISKLHRIVLENIEDEQFGVSELAHKSNISRSYLHRKIHLYKKQSASQFIKDIRLEEAYKLLNNDELNISEVAFKVGYHSASYFSLSFHNKYGVTPRELKKKNVISISPPNSSPQIILENNRSRTGTKKFKTKLILSIAASIIIIAGTLFVLSHTRNPEISIAVLPLDNLTGSDDNAYFVEGMHDVLIGELGKLPSIRVISRTSTLRYASKEMLLADIANELNVNTIVEGSVYGAKDSVRIVIQLIKVFPKEKHLWAMEYNEQMANVLQVKNQVIKQIANHINIKLNADESQKLSRTGTTNPESYKDYLRGMYYLKKGNREDYNTGVEYLHKSIERDPADPYAYAALSLGYAATGHGMAGEDAFLKATAAAKKALAIDPDLDDAHTALAMLYLYNKWDWSSANEAFENAVQTNPNNELAQANFAWYHVLFNDLDKAIYHAKKATEIDPFSSGFQSWLALIYLENNQNDQAERSAQKALKINPDNVYANLVLACTKLRNDSIAKALTYIEKLPKKSDYFNAYRSGFYAALGDTAKLREIWNYTSSKENPGIASSGIIAYHCGYKDLAFEKLRHAINMKTYPLQYIGHIPFTEPLYNETEFQTILTALNLPANKKLPL